MSRHLVDTSLQRLVVAAPEQPPGPFAVRGANTIALQRSDDLIDAIGVLLLRKLLRSVQQLRSAATEKSTRKGKRS